MIQSQAMGENLDSLDLFVELVVNRSAELDRYVERTLDVPGAVRVVRKPGTVELERFKDYATDSVLGSDWTISEGKIRRVEADDSVSSDTCGLASCRET